MTTISIQRQNERTIYTQAELEAMVQAKRLGMQIALSDWERCERRFRVPAEDDTVPRGSVRDLPGADRFLD